MGDSQILNIWTDSDRKLHFICLELKTVISALYHWATVLQGHQVMITTNNNTVVSYIDQQTGSDPFPYPVTSSSRSFSMASNSGHCHQGQVCSELSECDRKPPVLANSTNTDRVESPPQDRDSNLRDMVNSNSGYL